MHILVYVSATRISKLSISRAATNMIYLRPFKDTITIPFIIVKINWIKQRNFDLKVLSLCLILPKCFLRKSFDLCLLTYIVVFNCLFYWEQIRKANTGCPPLVRARSRVWKQLNHLYSYSALLWNRIRPDKASYLMWIKTCNNYFKTRIIFKKRLFSLYAQFIFKNWKMWHHKRFRYLMQRPCGRMV